MSRPDLVLAFHGTAKPAGQQVAARLLLKVAAGLPKVTVHLTWADVLTPTLSDTLTGLGRSIVVPCFLTPGYHVTADLPAVIRATGGKARLTPLLGASLDAVLARLEEAGGPGDAVVLAGAGSKRAASNGQVAEAARRLARDLGLPVVPAYLTAASPTPAEAVAALREAGHRRVAIASYLLSPGVFADRLHDAGADLVSEPIGDHQLVVDTIITRYRQAVRERVDLVGGSADERDAIA
ncbi:MAG: CbiX/SirB N-terminal domain-containing protein [Propionicimonas sp.]|nr:CbiX/SirB N-terminal domain-containing protein [Propionicimonas sp.]